MHLEEALQDLALLLVLLVLVAGDALELLKQAAQGAEGRRLAVLDAGGLDDVVRLGVGERCAALVVVRLASTR